jgi:hypothetical protein
MKFKYIPRKLKKYFFKNVIINRLILPLPTKSIEKNQWINVKKIIIDREEIKSWAEQYIPEVVRCLGTYYHKKILELFISYLLLEIKPSDSYLDAAGAGFSYIHKINCRKKYLHDINIGENFKKKMSGNIHFIDSTAAHIPLPNECIDKISCHHSFEHFQNNMDIDFIKEIQRLLTKRGKCVIVPLFLSNKHFLITDSFNYNFPEESGQKIRDLTSTLPGGSQCGFARVYSLESLKERIINNIDKNLFNITIFTVEMYGEAVPNMRNFFQKKHAMINLYYRALLIEKR